MLVAAIHFRPEKGNLVGNKETLLLLIKSALHQGATLVVAPELALSGFAFSSHEQMLPNSETVPGPFTQDVVHLTQEFGGVVVVGMAERDCDNRLFNSAVAIDATGVVGLYRQFPWFWEDQEKKPAPGPYKWADYPRTISPEVVITPFGIIDIVTCADIMRLTQPLSNHNENHLLTIPANWNDDPDYPCLPTWRGIAKSRSVPLVIANRHGDEVFSNGSSACFAQAISCIIDCDGHIKALWGHPQDHILIERL